MAIIPFYLYYTVVTISLKYVLQCTAVTISFSIFTVAQCSHKLWKFHIQIFAIAITLTVYICDNVNCSLCVWLWKCTVSEWKLWQLQQSFLFFYYTVYWCDNYNYSVLAVCDTFDDKATYIVGCDSFKWYIYGFLTVYTCDSVNYSCWFDGVHVAVRQRETMARVYAYSPSSKAGYVKCFAVLTS